MSNGSSRARRARAWASAILGLVLALGLPARAADPPVDHLSVPGPLRLDGIEFALAWSAARPPAIFRQEYLPAGQTLERYRQMLLLDLLAVDATPLEAAMHKLLELRELQRTDPTVNYDLVINEDSGGALLDFVLPGRTGDGDPIIEWNAYRYERIEGGVLMLGISRRGYGFDGTRRFIAEDLKANRQAWIGELAGVAMPGAVAPDP